jgi:hypothetical protein
MPTQNYSVLVSEIATITAISSTVLVNGDSNFGGIMDVLIDYAEGRLYRDLDLVSASIFNSTVVCSSGVRTVFLSTTAGLPLQIDALNLLTSAGTTSSNATRVPLVPATRAIVDMVYPSALSSNCGQPQYFARLSDTELILGPTPDQAYGLEMQATIRPAPLSASNSSTWLTQNVPELMTAACMISAAGYMRDFGAQSDNPQMAQSWEGQYKALIATAQVDSMRQKFESAAWTAQSPTPLATPPRA